MQGVRNLKGTDLNPMYVLIKPPSLEVLEQRLRDRKTETDESLRKRLAVAKTELDYGKWNIISLSIIIFPRVAILYQHVFFDDNYDACLKVCMIQISHYDCLSW